MILSQVRDSILTHRLIEPGDGVLAAVSGGGDSVALLRLLAELADGLSFILRVAHVNHGVRGPAADADEGFVRDLAARLGLECLVLRPGSAPPPAASGRVPEERLREIRMGLLAESAARTSSSRIALGHTMDDQAETILMRLIRGAGRRGLSAMAPAGPGLLIRPLLGIRRGQARAYLDRLGQPFRLDETNEDGGYLRNDIRARVLPLLAEINPAVVEGLAATSGLLADEDALLDEMALAWLAARQELPEAGPCEVEAAALSGLPAALARRVARLMAARAGGDPRGPSRHAVREMLDLATRGTPGDARSIGGGLTASREGSRIRLHRSGAAGTPAPSRAYCFKLAVPGRLRLAELGAEIRAILAPRSDCPELVSGGRRVFLDARKLGPEVTVRSRRRGDLFHPLGAPGGRKLKDFLIDRKVPRPERAGIPLVVGPEGIAWVVGQQIGHGYRVVETTQTIAVLEINGQLDLPGSQRII